MNLQKFKDELTKQIYGQDAISNKEKELCIDCKRPALEHCYSEAGIREFKISGLCEECFDSIFI